MGGRPARSRLRHGDGADAFPGGHLGDEALNLLLAAVFADVGHDDVGVQGETRARAVGVHPAGQTRGFSGILTQLVFNFLKKYKKNLTAHPI